MLQLFSMASVLYMYIVLRVDSKLFHLIFIFYLAFPINFFYIYIPETDDQETIILNFKSLEVSNST